MVQNANFQRDLYPTIHCNGRSVAADAVFYNICLPPPLEPPTNGKFAFLLENKQWALIICWRHTPGASLDPFIHRFTRRKVCCDISSDWLQVLQLNFVTDFITRWLAGGKTSGEENMLLWNKIQPSSVRWPLRGDANSHVTSGPVMVPEIEKSKTRVCLRVPAQTLEEPQSLRLESCKTSFCPYIFYLYIIIF